VSLLPHPALHVRVAVMRAVIRRAGPDKALLRAARLRPCVPPGIASRLDLPYDRGDGDAMLDVFRPRDTGTDTGTPRPVIVWVHGGGWIGGSRNEMREYLQILAGHGYVTVGVDYSRAPRRHHPHQARQVAAAVTWLRDRAPELRIDPERFVLAGDSAGAQIAAQLACAVTDPGYAAAIAVTPPIRAGQLRAAVLMCGAYDLVLAPRPAREQRIIDTVMYAYSGRRNYRDDPLFGYASVLRWLTPAFPPAFITAGNGDALLPQSRRMAAALAGLGADVDALFFDETPDRLDPHEYHLDLHTDAARQALERTLAHLDRHTQPSNRASTMPCDGPSRSSQ
jgi:acetyl esterase